MKRSLSFFSVVFVLFHLLALLHPATGEALAEPAVLLTAQSTLACVDRSGRPQPLPAWLAGA